MRIFLPDFISIPCLMRSAEYHDKMRLTLAFTSLARLCRSTFGKKGCLLKLSNSILRWSVVKRSKCFLCTCPDSLLLVACDGGEFVECRGLLFPLVTMDNSFLSINCSENTFDGDTIAKFDASEACDDGEGGESDCFHSEVSVVDEFAEKKRPP